MGLAVEPVKSDADVDDGLDHWVCDCTPDKAQCGTDVSGMEFKDFGPVASCVVCEQIQEEPCPYCGDVL